MRVIAGELGGRRLHAPHGSRTRPASDRVREALFMGLGPLGGEGVLKPGARVVVETHAKDDVPAASGVLVRERDRRYGETVVHMYRVADAGERSEGEGS